MALTFRYQEIETPHPRPRGGWKKAPFSAPWSRTMSDLRRELEHLGAHEVVILADIDRTRIRNDGLPYSNAVARSPGVTFAFESKHGALRYDCNTYLKMEDNVRAFVLTLERLRAIDRYGCTKGEQYAGWRALPPAGAPKSDGFATAEEAAVFVMELAGHGGMHLMDNVRFLLSGRTPLEPYFRRAAMAAHPDTGGSTEAFIRLQKAKAMIEQMAARRKGGA